MKPFYSRFNTNFGDHLNSWLWERLCPGLTDENEYLRLIGVGTLLSRDLDLVQGKKIVFGSGAGYASPPTAAQATNWDIRALRGPLTARIMGVDEELAITDAAWLVALLPEYRNPPTQKSGVSFVPHWRTSERATWRQVCNICEIDYVDPLDPCDKVFHQIACSELAIVESLHGAIIADLFRTPWIPVISTNEILKFKWLDWCASLKLDYHPYALPPSGFRDYLFQAQLPIRPGKIDLSPCSVAVDIKRFDIRHSIAPPKKAGITYHSKAYVKSVLRNARTSMFSKLTTANIPGITSWDEAHTLKLCQLFENLCKLKPNLSKDVVREEKIDQLNTAFQSMCRDYKKL